MKLALRRLLAALLLALPLAAAADDGPLPFDPEVDALLQKAASGDREARRAALDALLSRPDEAVHRLVVKLLRETKDDGVAEDALRAIGLRKSVAGYEAAVERLEHRTASVRSFAAVCLERLENPGARKKLLERADKERDALALKNAMRALGIVAKDDMEAGGALVRRFTHKESVVAANAVLACSSFTEEGAVRSKLAAQVGSQLNRTSDVRVRSACLHALGAIGTEKEIPELEKLQKTLRGSMNPLAMAATRSADIAIEKIRTGGTDPMSAGAFEQIFRIASDDERDPARDGDPEKEVPEWLDDGRRPGGRRGR